MRREGKGVSSLLSEDKMDSRLETDPDPDPDPEVGSKSRPLGGGLRLMSASSAGSRRPSDPVQRVHCPSFAPSLRKALIVTISIFILSLDPASGLSCYCSGHCPYNQPNGTCEGQVGSQCFAAVEEVWNQETERLEPETTYGCLPPYEGGLMQCKGGLSPHLVSKFITCCSDEDLCNLALKPRYVTRPTQQPIGYEDDTLLAKVVLVGVSCLLICVLALVILFSCGKLQRKTTGSRNNSLSDEEGLHYKDDLISSDASLRELIDCSSGSGSGPVQLVQRTIAKQLELGKIIGKGRYGQVIRAKWRGEDVAVKVFDSREEASWFREQDIYQTVLLRHENLLGFIAADIWGNGGETHMYLITDYHEHGSLHDYLQLHILDEVAMLRLMHSAVCGVCHLHTEIFGKQGKPAIAHRDIKSKNILVKWDGSCVVADFGLAVRYDSSINEIDVAPNPRVGTKRYMAPEILEESFSSDNFDAYKMADIYSFSLVLWEIARRCSISGSVDEYQVPYYEYVPNDPSFEEMKKLICVDNIRPALSQRWGQSYALQAVVKLMLEGWHSSPCVRLTSLRMKKTLQKLLRAAIASREMGEESSKKELLKEEIRLEMDSNGC